MGHADLQRPFVGSTPAFSASWLAVPLPSGPARIRRRSRTARRELSPRAKGEPGEEKAAPELGSVVKVDEVARRFPGSARAADAIYTAARLMEELGRVSGRKADLEQASLRYGRLVLLHPDHGLADDAALALKRPGLAARAEREARRIVIDPGHGGHDAGASGAAGLKEKEVALAVAQEVGRLLRREGVEVQLTRNDDEYVSLEERSRIANDAKADLFVSIHCNAASNRRLRGAETYTLNVAADARGGWLKGNNDAGPLRHGSSSYLTTKVNTEESQRLARRVQSGGRAAGSGYGLKDPASGGALPRPALARMPAVLVNIGHLCRGGLLRSRIQA